MSTNSSIARLIIFSAILTTILACSPKTYNTIAHSDNVIPFSIDCETFKISPFDKSESSQIGNVNCDELVLVYDQDSYGYTGPKSNVEEFRKTYNASRYSSVLAALKVEERLFSLMKDSVVIVNAYEGKPKKKAINDCETCNMIAELKFKGNTIYYQYQAKAMDESGYEIISKSINGDDYRWYFADKKDVPSGLSITSKNGNINFSTQQELNSSMKKALMSIRRK